MRLHRYGYTVPEAELERHPLNFVAYSLSGGERDAA
jgi:hypothetical protein